MNPLKKITVYNRFFGPLVTIRMVLYKILFLFLLNIIKLKKVRIRIFNFHIYIPLNNKGIGRVLFVFRQREIDQKIIMQKILQPGLTILDIGSNIGYYVLLENSIMNNTGKFYAIEPDPRNIELLNENISLNDLNKRSKIGNFAFSDYNGEGHFYLAERTNLSSLLGQKDKTVSTIQVQVKDFGTYLEGIEVVDLIRMDIEGAEIEVFASLLKALEAGRVNAPKYIVFEPHTEVYSDKSKAFAKTLNGLFEHNYKTYMMTSYEEADSTLRALGYEPDEIIKDCPFIRGIYSNIRSEDAVNLICNIGGIRTCCLKYHDN